MLTDPVADMLTRIRNANRALHDTTQMPASRLKQEIARLLKDEGYIRDFHVERKNGDSYDTLVIELKYGRSRERVITDLKRISKPGRRIYARKDRLPRVLGGMGIAILSTSTGLMTSRTAAERGVAPVVSAVDAGGALMYLHRPDAAQVASVEVTTDKARTAAIYRRPSKDFEDQASQGRPSALHLARAVPLQGGMPIVHEGEVVGAVGVSGASSADEDQELAVIGAEAAAEAAISNVKIEA